MDAGMTDAGEADAGDCDGGCGPDRACCRGHCANPTNDPQNCGACGTRCEGNTPYCTSGGCQALPCRIDAGSCSASGFCCGNACCDSGQLCCDEEGPVAGYAACYTPTADAPTCPQGCAPLCVSDRELKRDVRPADDRAVLKALLSVPVSTWSYRADPVSVRHLGPMAQDFHAAFGLGATDRAYDPIDAHGVAFSSIRALYALVREQDARIARLEQENAELRRRVGSLHKRR
jgi:hypothetical protein